ncbi:hypothetical protein [Bacillus nitroreducens]
MDKKQVEILFIWPMKGKTRQKQGETPLHKADEGENKAKIR